MAVRCVTVSQGDGRRSQKLTSEPREVGPPAVPTLCIDVFHPADVRSGPQAGALGELEYGCSEAGHRYGSRNLTKHPSRLWARVERNENSAPLPSAVGTPP